MDAPILRFSLILLSLFVSTGASYQTPNFTVTAPTPEAAKKVGDAAEIYRRDLAMFWLKQPLPNWSRPCKLRVRPGSMGAGGETKFQFTGGEVLNWNMYVQGPMNRILDSVLPHEVNHTIFACHFRRPLPRWADEGAATLFEHRSEQVKQVGLLNEVIKSEREFISLNDLLTMKEYPKGYRPMLIMYAEGYALADFLVQQGGREKYLKFMADGERMGWAAAIKANYHHGGVASLQKNWRSWVLAGMPHLKTPLDQMLADSVADHSTQPSSKLGVPRPRILDEYLVNTTVRLQSPDAEPVAAVKPVSGNSSGSGRTAMTAATPASTPTPNSLRNAIFFNKPTESAADVSPAAPTRENTSTAPGFRSASFEAPTPRQPRRTRVPSGRVPRASSGSGDARNAAATPFREVAAPSEVSNERPRRALEATGLTDDFNFPSHRQRKHLPQERTAVTGSIPQWAGFPRQKELF